MIPGAFFYHIFESLPRQGPGCTGATRKVWSLLQPLPEDPQILDIGCGTGTQTRDLAALSNGWITAVDNHQPFLDQIDGWVGREGVGDRVRTVNASMDALPFEKGSFDLIWSEGAIFIMGFAAGLAAWRPLCRPGGQVVVSDMTWFEPGAPDELLRFFAEVEGCSLATEEELVEQAREVGYRVIATYRLPKAGWWDHYYVPLLERIKELRKTHGANSDDAAVLDMLEHEAAIYRRYHRYYGYTFFVLQAI